MDHAVVNVSITVSKKGHPNGLFSMQGSVSPASTVSEPQSGILVVTVPVMRGKGTTGLVHVSNIIFVNNHGKNHIFHSLKMGDGLNFLSKAVKC